VPESNDQIKLNDVKPHVPTNIMDHEDMMKEMQEEENKA